VIIHIRSSLYDNIGPGCEFAEYPLMIPYDFDEILDLSIINGCIVFCDSIYYFIFLSCILKLFDGKSNAALV